MIGEVIEIHSYGGNRGPLYHLADKVARCEAAGLTALVGRGEGMVETEQQMEYLGLITKRKEVFTPSKKYGVLFILKERKSQMHLMVN